VVSELVQSQVVFTAFDPVAGRKGELVRIDVDPSAYSFWDLSPDGRWIAFGAREEASDRIRLLPLAGQAPREISAGGWTHLEFAAWAPDGRALYVTGWASIGAPLLRVPLEGEAQLLYKGGYYVENPVPSPDGRYLAFGELILERNAWVIENLR
jgi:Tol biopolymer transport system component